MHTTAAPRTKKLRAALSALAIGALALIGIVATPMAASAAPLVVSTTADFGAGSLRDQIAASLPGDTIVFQSPLFDTPQVIELESIIPIAHTITIQGPGQDLLTISRESGHGAFNQFGVVPGPGILSIDTRIQDLTIAGIDAGGDVGSAFVSSAPELANVDFNHVTFLNEDASANPGAGVNIDGASGDITFMNSAFTDNTAAVAAGAQLTNIGGAIRFQTVTFTNNDSTVGQGGAMQIDTAHEVIFSDGTTGTGNDAAGGGGIAYIQRSGGISITEGSFTDNSAGSAGGAFFIDTVTSVDFNDVVVAHNDASNFGGGGVWVQNVTGATKFLATTFDHNEAKAGVGGGVAVSASHGGLSFVASILTSNIAATNGGGLAVLTADQLVQINQSLVTDNEAHAGDGGGIHVGTTTASGSVQIFESSVLSNSAINGGNSRGGGFYGNSIGQTVFLGNSTFAGNQAESAGLSVAVNTLASFLQVSQSTFFETGTDQYVIAVNHSNLPNGLIEVAYSTVVGPGALAITDNNGDADAFYSIMDGGSQPAIVADVPVDAFYSLISSAADPGSITPHAGTVFGVSNMKLGQLQYNGGATMTLLPLAGSPALNAGNPALVGEPTFDQRGTGFPRVVGGIIDIGAVEAPAYLPATGGTIDPAVPLGGALLLLLGFGAVAFSRATRRS